MGRVELDASSPHEIGDSLADGHRGNVGIGAHAVGHDGCVGDAQVFEAVYPAVLIDDSHCVARRTHLAGRGDVVAGAHFAPHPLVERGVGVEFGVGGADALDDEGVERIVVEQVDDDADGFAQAAAV